MFTRIRSRWRWLRRASGGTLIPSLTIPLSLIGTCAVMYPLGYSLDNLSLMGLTIAVGFVVDDAIVMIENIMRYIEAGRPPLEAALEGAREVGFTIVSMTVSLIVVFTPILLMGGLVGRLFREFAVVVSIALVMSGIVSLTVTPMLCGWLILHDPAHQPGRLYRWSERFEAMSDRMIKLADIAIHDPAVLSVDDWVGPTPPSAAAGSC